MVSVVQTGGPLPNRHWGFAGVIGLLVLTLLGIAINSARAFADQRSDAVLIDIAGRQRMLGARYLHQILLASRGRPTAHAETRKILVQSSTALNEGGLTLRRLGFDETVKLPPAATPVIRDKLVEQRRQLERLFLRGGALLEVPYGSAEYEARLDDLVAHAYEAQEISEEVVHLLASNSEETLMEILSWQIAIVGLVVLSGVLTSWVLAVANRDHQRELVCRQRAEAGLRRSQGEVLDVLRQSDALKSALLSSVSHELRTPLTAIKSMVDRIFEGTVAVSVLMEYRDSIDREIDHLRQLVQNLLDMSRVEAGALQPDREWELFEDLVEGALVTTERALHGRQVELHLDEEIPPAFIDGVQIRQVLTNLLDNAAKYSKPATSIILTAVPNGDRVEVSVSNEGEEIPVDARELIFDRFYRIDCQATRTVRGSGLGLAICKAMVEAHGGRIGVECADGRVTFSFSLPLTGSDGFLDSVSDRLIEPVTTELSRKESA